MQSGGKQIAFPIDARLDQSIEQTAGAEPGTLSELINLRKDRAGKLVKRLGYPRVGPGGLASPVRLLPHHDSIAYADNSAMLLSYGEGINKFSTRDRAPEWVLNRARVVAQHPYFFTFAGCCSASGATFHIYIDRNVGRVMSVVVDEVSGELVREGPETLYTINAGVGESATPLARIVTDGTRLWVFFQVTAATTGLRCIATTVANIISGGAWPAAVSLGTIDPAAPSFDLHFTTSFAFVAYNFDNAGTKQLKVIRVDSTATVTHTYTVDVSCRSVSCLFDGTQLWVLYALTSGGGVNSDVRALSSTLSLLATTGGPGSSSGAIETTGLGFFDSNSVIMLVASAATAFSPAGHIKIARGDYAASAITYVDGPVSYGCYPASQPFRTGVGGDGSDLFMWVECATASTDPFASVALVALTHDGGSMYSVSTSVATALFPHLRVQNGRVSYPGQYANASMPAPGYVVAQKVYVSSQDSDTYVWDGCFRIPPETPAAIREYRFQRIAPFINAGMVPTEAHGLTLATGGAQCFAYDASRFTELGFCYPPQGTGDYVTMNGSGGSIGAGTYQWAVTYEYTDDQGLKHQSAPWISGTHVAVASDKAILAVPTLKMTTKQDREFSSAALRVVVWRTLATDAATFYRVTSAQNNPEVATVTVNDTFADGGISSNEILYTIRGELANECPPPLWHACQFNGRVAGIDAEYRDRIVFSKVMSAERGIEWSSANQTYVKGIGDLTALCEMDGNLYAFSATGIAFAASGAGIDETGNGSWPEAQIISRACGCMGPRAICVTQDGAIFVSRQGDVKGTLRAWLLPRGGGNPIEIGAKARGYLSVSVLQISGSVGTELDVTSCANWVDGGRVIITLKDEDNLSYWIEYDYVNRAPDGFGVWSAGYVGDFPGIASSVAVRGRHWLAIDDSSVGEVLRSSDLVFSDVGGRWVSWLLRTHDIKLTAIPIGKLNEVTVTFLENDPNGGVKFELSDNGFVSVTTNHTFDFDTVSGGYVQRQWQPDVRRSNKGMGYALQLSSLDPGEGGGQDSADVIPTAMSFDFIPLRGTHRPMASERA